MSSAKVTSLLIADARLLDPASGLDATGFLGIRDGKITYVGKSRPKDKYAKTLEAKGQWRSEERL